MKVYNMVWNYKEGYLLPMVSDDDYKKIYSDESKYILIKFTGYYDYMQRPIFEEDILLDKCGCELFVHYIPALKDYYVFDEELKFPIRLAEICSECRRKGNVYKRTYAILKKLESEENQ